MPFRGEEQESGRIASLRISGGAGPMVYKDDPESGSVIMQRIKGKSLSTHGLDDKVY